MKSITVTGLFCCLLLSCFSQDDYLFGWDKGFSAVISAHNVMGVHHIVSTYEDKNLRPTYWNENRLKGRVAGISFRLLKTLLIDFQVDYLTVRVQHEHFGHGARLRRFKYENNSYHIRPFPPFGDGESFFQFGQLSGPRQLGDHEAVAIYAGGLEGSALLARTIRDKWLRRGSIHYRESLLYLTSFHDHILRILFNSKVIGIPERGANDLNFYLEQVNVANGVGRRNPPKIDRKFIANRAMINLFNTYHIFALHSFFAEYIVKGETNFKYPMISLGKVLWLPSARFGLTPFGSEWIFENHLKNPLNKSIINTKIRLGDQKLKTSWGAGFSFHQQVNPRVSWAIGADIWKQPEMELGGERAFYASNLLGGLISFSLDLKIFDQFPIGFFSQLAYKSSGYIEGERLDKGPIIRLGFSTRD